jgi:hypothetical protein
MKSIAHPYRRPTSSAGHASSVHGEELIFYLALCVVGAIPLASLVAHGGAFGAEPTVGLMMILAGLAGLFAAWRVARNARVS